MDRLEANRRVRARLSVLPGAEALEDRGLMTAGGGSTVAILRGQVAAMNVPTVVNFTLDPKNVETNRGAITLGFDVAAPTTSKLAPVVAVAADVAANPLHPTSVRILPGSGVLRGTSATDATPSPTLVTLGSRFRPVALPTSLAIQVAGVNATTGDFLAGVYLPGDADGSGKVDAADLKAIRSRLRSSTGSLTYSFDADSNRDGRIGFDDLMIAYRNKGASVSLAPVITSNLDPATDTGNLDRVTTTSTAHFTGVASANATITYADATGKAAPVTVPTSPMGTYDITLPLVVGPNRFRVSMVDTSGQSISGLIDPVNYYPGLESLTS